MSECVFCRKINAWGDEYGPAIPVFNELVYTFEPINPVVYGHRLFVPRAHVEHDDTNADNIEFWLGQSMAAAEWFARAEGIGSWNLITSAGAAATQTVAHLHVHLVPRRDGDGLALPWTETPPQRIMAGLGQDVTRLLPSEGGGPCG